MQTATHSQGCAAIVGTDAACIAEAIPCRQGKVAGRGLDALSGISHRADGSAGMECDVTCGLELGFAQCQITTAGGQLHGLATVQRCAMATNGEATITGLPLATATTPLGTIDRATAADGQGEILPGKADIVVALAITAGTVAEAGGSQAEVMAGDDGTAAEAGSPLADQAEILPCIEAGITQLQAAAITIGSDGDIAGGGQLIIQQNATRCSQGEITTIGCDISQHAHPDAGFGRHQENTVGIHATQACRINSKAGGTPHRAGAAGHTAGDITPAVGAGIHTKVGYIHLATN